MTRHRIMAVYGTRPEAIKVAPVLAALSRHSALHAVPVVTGQHREMLDQVNSLFGILPDHDLDIFRPGQSLAKITERVLDRLDPVLVADPPAAVLVQGDTTTAMAAALAAFYRRIPVIHLEAGLRSGTIDSPFPEEANRRVITQVAALHLAPTELSRANLLRESIPPETIAVTGNTVIDAFMEIASRPVSFTDARVSEIVEAGRPLILVTTHRRENWGDAMVAIGRAVAEIATARPDHDVVLPMHRNPVVRDALLPALGGLSNVTLTEPLPYGEFARLIKASRLVLTDSGGIQEEAPSLGIPVLVLRTNTERPEAVTSGTVRLIGTDQSRIVEEVDRVLDDPSAYAAMAKSVNPYGDGQAAERSVAAIAALLGVGSRLPDFRAAQG